MRLPLSYSLRNLGARPARSLMTAGVVALAVGMGAGDSWADCPGTASCSLSESESVTQNCDTGRFDFETTIVWAVPTNPVPIIVIQPNSSGGSINVTGVQYDPSFLTSRPCSGDFEISVQGFLVNKANDGVVNSEVNVNPSVQECYASDETFIPKCE